MAEPVPFPGSRTSQARTTNGDVYVIPGGGLVGIDVSGTWTATVFFEATTDWTNWYTVNAVDPSTGTLASNTNTIGNWTALVGNALGFRCRVASITGGTVQIDLNGGGGSPPYQPIVIPALPPQTSVVAPAANLTANGQSNGTTTNGCAVTSFGVSGTWVGDLQFQVSNDNVTFVPASAIRIDTQPVFGRDVVTHTTTNGTFAVDSGGWTFCQCKFISYTSGTAVVNAVSGTGSGIHYNYPANRGRNVKAIGMAATLRIPGNSTTPQTLLTLHNQTGTAVLLGIRDVNIAVDSTAAQTGLYYFRVSRSTTLPTGGTSATKVLTDTTHTSDSNVVILGGASADGTSSIITATAGTTLYQTFGPRQVTTVGYFANAPIPGVPDGLEPLDMIVLRAGEFLIVQAVWQTGANNVSTVSYLASIAWEEFTYNV